MFPELFDFRLIDEPPLHILSRLADVPLARLLRDPAAVLARQTAKVDELGAQAGGRSPAAVGEGTGPADELIFRPGDSGEAAIYLVCRRGNDSLVAARALRRYLGGETAGGGAGGQSEGNERAVEVLDVKGGLVGWAREVDEEFPVY